MTPEILNSQDLEKHSILIHEPFAAFLMASRDEQDFELTLLDVVRFAGHACPSMIGAFLITQKAVEELYPETGVCIRGDLAVEIPASSTSGPIGPMANVFSFITGAWSDTGFGGLRGDFKRRHLLRFDSNSVPGGAFRFTRLSNGTSIDVFYDPSRASVSLDPSEPFQIQWRRRIKAILADPDRCVTTEPVKARASDVVEQR